MTAPRLRPQFRLAELLLLALAAGITVAAALPQAVTGVAAPTVDLRALWPAAALVGIFVAIHLSLSLAARGADPVLLPTVLALMGLGWALNERLAPLLVDRQVFWLLLGALLIGLVAHLPIELRLLQRYRYTWALLGIGLVALTLVGGHSAVAGGPRLWLGVGPLSFQPSEVLKLLLVIFLAGYLEDKRELLSEASSRLGQFRLMPLPYLAPLVVMLGVSLALLAAQRDLGAALLLFTIALGMLYLASSRPVYVIAGLALFLAGAWLMYRYLGIVHTRVEIWWNPWADPSDTGFQLIQSLLALAAGGVMGTGIGLGAPTLIPAVHTDFIFAAVAEEMGIAGATAVLALYALLVARGFRIAVRARSPFQQLLAAGLTFALGVQTLIIVGGVVKLIPLTGITLPFLSHGGTSMLVSAVMVGLLLRVSREPV